MLEENKTQETETSRSEEVIPIEWEDVKELYAYRQELTRAENYLASLLLNHEKTKQDLLERISAARQEIYQDAALLRERLNVSSEFTYELKMPESPEEKAYFVRKDS